MSDSRIQCVQALKDAIGTISDRVHDSTEWWSSYYASDRGVTLIDQLVGRILDITQTLGTHTPERAAEVVAYHRHEILKANSGSCMFYPYCGSFTSADLRAIADELDKRNGEVRGE